MQLPITSALLCAFTTISIRSIPHRVASHFDLLLPNTPLFYPNLSDPLVFACRLWSKLTSFDADVGAADLAGLVFGSAEVVVVVDVAVVGGGREGV